MGPPMGQALVGRTLLHPGRMLGEEEDALALGCTFIPAFSMFESVELRRRPTDEPRLSVSAQTDDEARVDDLELLGEVLGAVRDFAGLGCAISGRVAVHHVRDKDL